MKIVWRNPNPINRTSFSIVKTLAVEQPEELRVFYCSSRGPSALGTMFELVVHRNALPHADNPSVNHSVSSKCPPAAMPDSPVGPMHSRVHWILDTFASLSLTCLA